jgi:hypothetical protein
MLRSATAPNAARAAERNAYIPSHLNFLKLPPQAASGKLRSSLR